MISIASRRPSEPVTVPEVETDYFASEAHYQSLAGRILAALREGARFAVVTGDPPPNSDLLSKALMGEGEPRHRVACLPCGPELTCAQLRRAISAVEESKAGSAVSLAEPAEHVLPLLIFENAERLSDDQLEDIGEAMQPRDGTAAAGVLLARPALLARFEEPGLQVVKGRLAGQFCVQELGQEEFIEFLRHQLVNRYRSSEVREAPHGVQRGLAALGVLAVAGLCCFLLLQPILKVGEPLANAATGALTTGATSTPPSLPAEITRDAPAQITPASRLTEDAPIGAAQPSGAPETTTTPGVPVPAPPAGGLRLPRAEIAALVSRGDSFLNAGDIASAQLFYERAADAGDGSAALRLAATFDPAFLGRTGIRGVRGDPDKAASWYRRARELEAIASAPKSAAQRGLEEPVDPAR